MRKRMVVCCSHSPLMSSADGGEPGQRIFAALDVAASRIRAFDPDLVVFFGADHVRAFVDLIPAVAIVGSATGHGDWGTADTAYDVDPFADQLAIDLLAGGFDVATAKNVRLDHGFGQTFAQLFGELDAAPIVPVFMNCARPPLAPLGRAVALGKAIGDALDSIDRRVLLVGSGGLSHSPPVLDIDPGGMTEDERRRYNMDRLEEAGKKIREPWDRDVLAAFERHDLEYFEHITEADLLTVGPGASEIRTWVAAAAAGGQPLETLAYEPVPAWITGMGIATSTDEALDR